MTPRKEVTVLLVDDHRVVRAGLAMLIGGRPGFRVIGEASDVQSGVAEALRLKPDVVLMDLRLPDGTGVDACRAIKACEPGIQVLFLTSTADEDSMLAAVLAGAAGFVLKQVDEELLLGSIDLVARGQSIMDSAMIHAIQVRLHREAQAPVQPAGAKALSLQEQRVLRLVAEGKTNKEIASELQLSDHTVRNYLSHIFQKLKISRRSQAAVLASDLIGRSEPPPRDPRR
ncbi:response regulator [Candidatus Nitrospira bockiana]